MGGHVPETQPEPVHQVAVFKDAHGKYYCSFVYDDTEQSDQEGENKPGRRWKKRKHYPLREDGIVAFDLGIKTLATGFNDQGRFYHIGGFKGYRWDNKKIHKIGFTPDPRNKKSPQYIQHPKIFNPV